MLFLGHLGISVVAGQLYNDARRARLDLRMVALFAMAPDLFDKPLALFFPVYFGYHTRLLGHSLLAFVLFVTALSVQTGRRRLKPSYGLLYGAAWLGHLLLDRVWIYDLQYFLWPYLGSPAPRDPIFIRLFATGGFHPGTRLLELLGLVALLAFIARYRLYRADRLKLVLQTGHCSRGNLE